MAGGATYMKSQFSSEAELKSALDAAAGRSPCELVIRGARVLDVWNGSWRDGDVAIHGGKIVGIGSDYTSADTLDATGMWLVPGFIDAHVHLESSMMTPARFAEAVLPLGTTTVVWDPHEIANVRGVEGIQWALDASEGIPLDVFVMAPSCVPATSPALGFETSGAELEAPQIAPFRAHPRVLGLAEFMNFPGLVAGTPETNAKIMSWQGLPKDGHCPGLSGKTLQAYSVSGVASDHESTHSGEAREKLAAGIHVLIREGSCARDADALLEVLTPLTAERVAFCTDDRNPLDMLREGHINVIVNKALSRGIDPVAVFRAVSSAPARMFGLNDRGSIAPGYKADLCLVTPAKGKDFSSGLVVREVIKSGRRVSRMGEIPESGATAKFSARANCRLPEMSPEDFRVVAPEGKDPSKPLRARVIGLRPGQILTDLLEETMTSTTEGFVADVGRDLLKLAVIERYNGTKGRAVGFARGFGLRAGAMATTINHDSHNVIVLGTSDAAMARAVNELRRIDGGMVVIDAGGTTHALRLEIGGLMTSRRADAIAEELNVLREALRSLGCPLEEPFLQLSFLALPVIPTLKLTDRGLVNVLEFRRVALFC